MQSLGNVTITEKVWNILCFKTSPRKLKEAECLTLTTERHFMKNAAKVTAVAVVTLSIKTEMGWTGLRFTSNTLPWSPHKFLFLGSPKCKTPASTEFD